MPALTPAQAATAAVPAWAAAGIRAAAVVMAEVVVAAAAAVAAVAAVAEEAGVAAAEAAAAVEDGDNEILRNTTMSNKLKSINSSKILLAMSTAAACAFLAPAFLGGAETKHDKAAAAPAGTTR